jgi:inosine-uridine nucleoside N-ribohydrolase
MNKITEEWRFALCIALLIGWLSLFSCFAQATWASSKEAASPLIIDTDVGIDDWSAILYLLNVHEINLLGITVTGTGEAHSKPGARIVLNILSLAGREAENIPVAYGDEAPLDGYHIFWKHLREEIDNVYGETLPHNPGKPVEKHAVELLFSLLEAAKKPIDVLALGPLTNIAQLLDQHPTIKSKIKHIYIMGGAVYVKGNVIVPGITDYIKNKVAEWNIYIDPLAAQKVFRSGIPLTLIPLNATNAVQITEEFTQRFKRYAKSPEAKFMDRIFDKNKEFVASGEYYFWDPLAAAIAVNPELCMHYEMLSLDVMAEYAEDTPGDDFPSFPKLNWQGQIRRQFDPFRSGQTVVSDEGGKIRVCIYANAAEFENLFIERVNRD